MRNSCQIKIMNILNTFTCHPVQIFQVDIGLIQNSTSICIRVNPGNYGELVIPVIF